MKQEMKEREKCQEPIEESKLKEQLEPQEGSYVRISELGKSRESDQST